MNKAELAKKIVDESSYEISEAMATDFINTFTNAVKEEVASGGIVQLIGFGTFKTIDKQEHTCVNPQTKKTMTVPARTVPKFVPGQAFKDMV